MRLRALKAEFEQLLNWSETSLEERIKEFSERNDFKISKVAQPIRAALTGTTVTPSIFEVLVVLGKEECLARISDVIDEQVETE